MPDIEKVMNGLEHCSDRSCKCDECAYWNPNRTIDDEYCGAKVNRDALELLKAEQPKHGHWIDNDDPDDNYFTCSVCGDLWILNDGTPEDNQMNYCPHCGARMDGEQCGS